MNQDILNTLVIDIEKAKKGAEIGTIKEYNVGGKKVKYIKTSKGWRPYSQKKAAQGEQQKQEENTTKEQSSTSQSAVGGAPSEDAVKTLIKYAKEADTENLKKFINNPNSPKWIVDIAKKELENRGENTESSSKESNAQEKKEISSKQENTANTSSKDGFKKITQTYVKVNRNTIVLNMKGDDKYKAKKGSFYMESEPNESLVAFKKKVKEAAEKHFSGNSSTDNSNQKTTQNQETKPTENSQSTSENAEVKQEEQRLSLDERAAAFKFKTEEEVSKYLVKRNSLDSIPEDDKNITVTKNSFSDPGVYFDLQTLIEKYKDDESVLEDGHNLLDFVYQTRISTDDVKVVNLFMKKNGLREVADDVSYLDDDQLLEYTNYTRESKLFCRKAYEKKMNSLLRKVNETYKGDTKDALYALTQYTGMAYTDYRLLNEGEIKDDNLQKMNDTLTELIDKHPLKENMVLTRRLSFHPYELNKMNKFFIAEVGDIIEDKSFQSFAIKPQNLFGSDFQITLLAKKGDKVMNALNQYELEYIVQRGVKYKVLKKGFNSIVVEIV